MKLFVCTNILRSHTPENLQGKIIQKRSSTIDSARRVTENAFGLLSQTLRIFYHPINLETTTIDDLVWTFCCVHNMLREGYLETKTVFLN